MVVAEKLIKHGHFVIVKSIHKETNIVDIYMKEITRSHGISKEIISDMDSMFTS